MLRLAVAIWLFLGGLAVAQVVTVRSGEHEGFIRLVLTFPEPAGWDLGRTADGYGFRARVADWRYDISSVFDLIPRDRLSALWVDPESGALRLGLSCNCHAIATPFRPGIVVVDIFDGPAPAESPYEAALSDAGRIMPPLVARRTVRPKPRPAGLVPEPDPEPVVLPNLILAGNLATPSVQAPLAVRSKDPRAQQMRDLLLRDLSRSIAAGAVRPVAQLPTRTAPEPASRPVLVPLSDEPGEATQLRIRAADAPPGQTVTDAGRACIPDDRLDLAAWGNESDPADQLVKAQADLLGEFDRPDRERLIALVRLHLHLGFGAEARSLIRLWGANDPEAETLEALGLLVDGGTGASAFAGMLACDSAAALWAMLAHDQLVAGSTIDRAAVLRAFSALPLGLRRHLGPGVSDRFLQAGDTESARAIRDAIDRAPGPHGEGLTMIDAKLDLADGKSDAAERKLESVIAKDGAAAAQALAALIESRIARNEAPDTAQVLALESMLREGLSSPDVGALRQALAKGQTVTGNADRAFREHAALDPALFPDLWGLLARHGPELELASLALDPPGVSVATLPDAVRLSVAERLRSDGFAEGARRWADGVATAGADLLLAQVALDLRDGREALRRLGGQTGEPANTLRARALEILGDLPAATAAWDAAGSTADAARVQFVARQWDALTPAEDPALRRLLDSRTASASVAADTTIEAPLAQARALLDRSGSARETIAAVLAARQVPGG